MLILLMFCKLDLARDLTSIKRVQERNHGHLQLSLLIKLDVAENFHGVTTGSFHVIGETFMPSSS